MALLHAIKKHNYDAAVAALKASPGAVNVVDSSGWTPLHFAVHGYLMEIVELLLKGGANVNAKTQCGNAPLHLALLCRTEIDIISSLLAHGANVDVKNNVGQTPLHIAALRGAVLEMRLLLAHGADVDSCCALGHTPLYLANRWTDVTQLLVEAGASISPAILERTQRNNMDFVIAAAAKWGFSSLRSAWVAACVWQEYNG